MFVIWYQKLFLLLLFLSSSYSSSLSDSEQDQQISSSSIQTGLMSRRSLRLDEGLLDRSLPRSGASYGVGRVSWGSSRPRHSQRHSASCSESLLAGSPRKPGGHFLHDSSLHSLTSDASLISSLLEESSIRESTLVETFWGTPAHLSDVFIILHQAGFNALLLFLLRSGPG